VSFLYKSKRFSKREGHEFTYKQLGIDFEFPEFMETFPSARTFPQIIVDGEKVGGYTEYEALVK